MQTQAAIETARIHGETELRKAELEARVSWRWQFGVLLIFTAIALAGIASLFTGQAAVAKEILQNLMIFFGGYGAALAGRKKRG